MFSLNELYKHIDDRIMEAEDDITISYWVGYRDACERFEQVYNEAEKIIIKENNND